MQAPPSAASRSRSRVAGLRLPDLPPRDLERLAAGPHSAPAPSSTPNSATNSTSYPLPAPTATPTKFGGDGSPADVRAYSAAAPLLMRGGVVSPGRGGGSGLVLPNLSLPIAGQNILPPVSIPSSPHPHQLLSVPPNSLPRHVVPRLPSRTGSRTTPTSPVTSTQMTQNEIKKAQNRKSAKRFREAQKQRWKNMADDLMLHKRTINDLRAQLVAQASSVAQANDAFRAHAIKDKRNAVSINDLVEPSQLPSTSTTTRTTPPDPPQQQPSHMQSDAEAALYAQILSNTAQNAPHLSVKHPYVAELGVLTVCVVVVSTTTRVVSIRRGNPTTFGTFAVDGLPQPDETEFRNALTCGKPVAVAYSRRGQRVNAVMNPIENSDRVVVAEFTPFQ